MPFVPIEIDDYVTLHLKSNPDEKGWTDAYKAFIQRLRKHYPKAAIYCASGSMMSDSWPKGQHALSVDAAIVLP